ncbi:LppA family lipoprotein [Nocardia sp. NPDC051750]|uniref:LppA family lipoprotein n=1 Tax=Nocardia sp. NPDC051750 TaxID=3364325 RepID=UPI003791CCAB
MSLTALLLTGCTSSAYQREEDTPTPEEIAHAEAQMRKLPSVEETHQQLTLVVERIADAAAAIAPELVWEKKLNRTQSPLGCPRAYNKTDGTSKTTDTLISPVPISDTAWPPIIDEARRIAAESGITVFTIRFDEPGHHDITLHSPDQGNQINIGTRVASSIRGLTGCRYSAEDLHSAPHP